MKKPSSFPQPPPCTTPLLLLSALLLALIYFLLFPNDFLLQSALTACAAAAPAAAAGAAYSVKPDFRLLLGVLTRADFYERRARVRLAYALQPPPSRAVIDVRFVLCNVSNEEDAVLVALEAMAYGDIIVLDCTENMDNGKTYTYFSTVPKLTARAPYDYVAKTDNDTYYRLGALADALRGKARRDMYYGFLTPCHVHTVAKWMSGMGYVLSWDLVAWIAATGELQNDLNGPEDMLMGRWLRWGGKGKNKYGAAPRMYDYWNEGQEVTCSRHALDADTVAVHKLKDRLQWARTLRFFNVTQGVKPSEL